MSRMVALIVFVNMQKGRKMTMNNTARLGPINALDLGSEEAKQLINKFTADPDKLDENGAWFTFTDGDQAEYAIKVKPEAKTTLKIEVFPMFVNTSKSLAERRPWSFAKIKGTELVDFLNELNSKKTTVKTLMMFK